MSTLRLSRIHKMETPKLVVHLQSLGVIRQDTCYMPANVCLLESYALVATLEEDILSSFRINRTAERPRAWLVVLMSGSISVSYAVF
jgi:hypothetical protein